MIRHINIYYSSVSCIKYLWKDSMFRTVYLYALNMALLHYSITQNAAVRLNYIFSAITIKGLMVYASIFLYVHLFIWKMSFAASPFQSSAYLRLTLLLIAINFESIKGLDVQKKKMHFEGSSTRFSWIAFQ